MQSTQPGEVEEVGEAAMAVPDRTIVLLRVGPTKIVLQVLLNKEIWNAGIAENQAMLRQTAENVQPEGQHQ